MNYTENNIAVKEYIDISHFVADAAYKGYSLLRLHSIAKNINKYPKSLISFVQYNYNTKYIEEAYSWLFNIISYVVLDEIEVINQEIISDYSTFYEFLTYMDEVDRDEFLWQYLAEFNVDNFDDIDKELLDNFLNEYPLKVSTISSKLFDYSDDLVFDISSDISLITASLLNLDFDMYVGTIINVSAEHALHSTTKYKSSLTIITEPSTPYVQHNFSDSKYFDDNSPTYYNSLKEAYTNLINY